MSNYRMIIDLDLCIGCNACTVACKAEHGTQPGVFWGYVLQKEYGTTPAVTRLFLPVLCNHCEDAPCEEVCPTGATYRSSDGLVLIDHEKCIGCRACMTACPYDVRWYVEKEKFYFPQTPIPYGVEELRGCEKVVQKCNFCADRIGRGLEPRCVEVCPTYCRTFGDLDDPDSEVSRLERTERTFALRPEARTRPRVRYLMKKKLDLLTGSSARPGLERPQGESV
ncbi:MAG TPA: 4Fe-4S dicluster domain-containing protein [Candidatus Binatia bacterium]|nr:4Fe-4S dicluster domain-containing protein [Candidatus Binatia bacterium]